MRRITKFFVFLLLFAALATALFNVGCYLELQDRTEALYKRDLRHWLSLQARMELVEEAVAVIEEPTETEPITEYYGTEAETDIDTEADTEADTKAASETDALVEDQTATA